MTYREFQRQVGKAGLTLSEFAQLMRMNRGSISNHSKRGEVPLHLAIIASLLGEMAERGMDFRPVFQSIDIQPRKPREGSASHQAGNRLGGNATTLQAL